MKAYQGVIQLTDDEASRWHTSKTLQIKACQLATKADPYGDFDIVEVCSSSYMPDIAACHDHCVIDTLHRVIFHPPKGNRN